MFDLYIRHEASLRAFSLALLKPFILSEIQVVNLLVILPKRVKNPKIMKIIQIMLAGPQCIMRCHSLMSAAFERVNAKMSVYS